MDQNQTELDAVLGELNFDAIAGDVPAVEEATADPAEEEPVALAESEDGTESAEADDDPPQAAAPTPSDAVESKPPIDYDSDDNPYKAKAQKIEDTLEKAYQQWQAQQTEQNRAKQMAEVAERIAKLSDEYTPEQAKREAQRIVHEVEAEFRQQTQPVLQSYEEKVSEREQVAEELAKRLAAYYTTVQRRFSPDELKALEAEVEYALKFDSPEAMEAHFGHVDATTKEMKAKIELLSKQNKELKLAQKAQARIESGVDNAGTGVGKPAVGGTRTRTDEAVASAFAAAGLAGFD